MQVLVAEGYKKFMLLYTAIFLVALRPYAGYGFLIHKVSRSHTTHHSREDSSRRVIGSSQSLPDNTQRSQKTDIHAPGGIRTHNLSRRAAAYTHLLLGRIPFMLRSLVILLKTGFVHRVPSL